MSYYDYLRETFAKPKIVILSPPIRQGGGVGAVRNISKFGTITGFEILHSASLHSE